MYTGAKVLEEVKQGQANLKKSKDFLKNSIFSFRFSPDHEQSGRFAKEAVKHFRRSGEKYYELYIEALMLSAEANNQMSLFNHAGVDYEEAAGVYEKMGNPIVAVSTYENAATMYTMNNQLDQAATMFLKAANLMVEKKNESEAIRLFDKGCVLLENQERAVNCEPIFNSYISFLMNSSKFNETIEVLHRQCRIFQLKPDMFTEDISKCLLSIGIIYLFTKEYSELKSFISNEFSSHEHAVHTHITALTTLFEAVGTGKDKNDVSAVIKSHPCVRYTHNAIAKLLRRLDVDPEAAKYCQVTEAATVDDFIFDEASEDEDNLDVLL